LVWYGFARSQFVFQWTRSRGVRNIFAVFFSVYAVTYPLLVWTAGLGWPRMPVFAVPCPTTLLTVGLLLSAQSGLTRTVAIIPLMWCFIAGSAALVLGVPPDLALLLAGFALLVALFGAPASFPSACRLRRLNVLGNRPSRRAPQSGSLAKPR
jgi:Family of unknown function (DUF6064)